MLLTPGMAMPAASAHACRQSASCAHGSVLSSCMMSLAAAWAMGTKVKLVPLIDIMPDW